MNGVISGNPSEGNAKIVFKGTYDECLNYMRNHTGWGDLVRLDSSGEIRGYSSWVL